MSTRVVCTHPPREWFRGQLLPCAHPECSDGVSGETFNILIEDYRAPHRRTAIGLLRRRFRRHLEMDDDLRGEHDRYSWELTR